MPKHKPHFLQNVVQYPHAIGTPMCSHICGVIGIGEQPPPTSCMFPQLLKALMASCFKSGKDRGEFHFRSGNFCEPTLFYRVFTRTFYCIRHICEFDSVLRRCNIIHANNIFFSNPPLCPLFFFPIALTTQWKFSQLRKWRGTTNPTTFGFLVCKWNWYWC